MSKSVIIDGIKYFSQQEVDTIRKEHEENLQQILKNFNDCNEGVKQAYAEQLDNVRKETWEAARSSHPIVGMKYDKLEDYLKTLQPHPASTKEKDKREWEIVNMKHGENGDIHPYMEKSCARATPPCIIHSVRRLTDGLVLQVWKTEVIIKKAKEEGFSKAWVINKFEIKDNACYADGINIKDLYVNPKTAPTPTSQEQDKPLTNNDDVACLTANEACELFTEAMGRNDKSFREVVDEKVNQKLKNI